MYSTHFNYKQTQHHSNIQNYHKDKLLDIKNNTLLAWNEYEKWDTGNV